MTGREENIVVYTHSHLHTHSRIGKLLSSFSSGPSTSISSTSFDAGCSSFSSRELICLLKVYSIDKEFCIVRTGREENMHMAHSHVHTLTLKYVGEEINLRSTSILLQLTKKEFKINKTSPQQTFLLTFTVPSY